MSGFDDIIGQEAIKEHLIQAIAQNKTSHAYILQGEKHAGKMFIAKRYAMALQCEAKEGRPCLNCPSCKQILSDNHPDVITITHEKTGIGVNDIRQQLNNDMAILPYKGPKKIYLIPDGEKMTQEAQNALLKTLEEPPAYGVIMILTTSADSLLPTIRSRCVLLSMKAVPKEILKPFLMRGCKVTDYKADICCAFAQGNLGRAMLLAESDSFEKLKDTMLNIVKNLDRMDIATITKIVKEIAGDKKEEKTAEAAEEKGDPRDFLDLLSMWYRDILLYKATRDMDRLIFCDEITYMQKVADRSTYEGIEEILEGLETARVRLNANVSFETVMELLFLTMQENGG
ncbi:MAG: DNA polymerase III subunit [Lachnospiraceae bacterium]|nr:DNA polymerase III subunit [Lachnospiraceae bacterium]